MDNNDNDNTSFASTSSFQSLVRSGGDPFFLSEENDIQDEPSIITEEEESMEGPSDLFLNMAMSSSGGGDVMSVVGKGMEESSSCREIKEEDDIAEIEAIGGDQFFLTNDDNNESIPPTKDEDADDWE